MTSHDCKTLRRGCYRCDLNVDELRHALAEMEQEVKGIEVVVDHLEDRALELRGDIREMKRSIDRWDMGL